MVENNIRKIRLIKEMSQMDLAIKTGLSKSYISELERYKKNPSLKVFYKIADALEICPKDLLVCNCSSCKEIKP